MGPTRGHREAAEPAAGGLGVGGPGTGGGGFVAGVWVVVGLVHAGLTSLAVTVGVAYADPGERGPVKAKPCVRHRLATPYRGYGYDHEVALHNTCNHVERCRIESPSADGVVTVELAGGAREVVLLRRGSPARQFEAKVTCQAKNAKNAK